MVLIFLAILTVGFVFEIGRGALKINSRQTRNLQNSKLNAIGESPGLITDSPYSTEASSNHVSSSFSRDISSHKGGCAYDNQ